MRYQEIRLEMEMKLVKIWPIEKILRMLRSQVTAIVVTGHSTR